LTNFIILKMNKFVSKINCFCKGVVEENNFSFLSKGSLMSLKFKWNFFVDEDNKHSLQYRISIQIFMKYDVSLIPCVWRLSMLNAYQM